MSTPLRIIAVDWAKHVRKRSAFEADLQNRRISHLPIICRLADLLEYAASFRSPVLLTIDAAIGFPTSAWHRLTKHGTHERKNFLDFLRIGKLPTKFFDPVSTPKDWKPEQPFISPPSGRKWSLHGFRDASNDGIFRAVDKRLNAQSIFVTSGLPGTVGSGTVALWKEFIQFTGQSFSVWPFDGPLNRLLELPIPIVCEIYPKACYGLALSPELPAPLLAISKTRPAARMQALKKLNEMEWIKTAGLVIQDQEKAAASEDDFDALLSAVALARLFLENAPLESPTTVDPIAEGAVLGEASLTHKNKRLPSAGNRDTTRIRVHVETKKSFSCPISGCEYVFKGTRGGWDAHVASLRRHPLWHPASRDPKERKRLFRDEFPNWFSS